MVCTKFHILDREYIEQSLSERYQPSLAYKWSTLVVSLTPTLIPSKSSNISYTLKYPMVLLLVPLFVMITTFTLCFFFFFDNLPISSHLFTSAGYMVTDSNTSSDNSLYITVRPTGDKHEDNE